MQERRSHTRYCLHHNSINTWFKFSLKERRESERQRRESEKEREKETEKERKLERENSSCDVKMNILKLFVL